MFRDLVLWLAGVPHRRDYPSASCGFPAVEFHPCHG